MSKEFPKIFGKTSEKFGIGASKKVILVTVFVNLFLSFFISEINNSSGN